MSEEITIVGGSIFGKIKCNPNVTPNLAVCLYCKVSQSEDIGKSGFSHKNIDYGIPLDCVNGNAIKQCPACKTLYLLKDPTEK